MKKRYNFTLVELLVVIGIIAILAGLVLGAVTIGQTRGRNTQAKSDMASIIMALRAVETTYGKIVNTSKSFDGVEPGTETSTSSDDTWRLGKGRGNIPKSYDNFIAELSVPGNKAFTSTDKYNINKRKLVFLEPRAGFNPEEKYTEQRDLLWRDPWGSRYVNFIHTSGDKYIKVSDGSRVASDIAIYSFGPNGADDNGCHADLDTCVKGSDTDNHKNHDDITSWRK